MRIRQLSRERRLDRLYLRLEQRRCDWFNAHRTGPLSSWHSANFAVSDVAVIVPMPEDLLNDPDFDLWAEIEPSDATLLRRLGWT